MSWNETGFRGVACVGVSVRACVSAFGMGFAWPCPCVSECDTFLFYCIMTFIYDRSRAPTQARPNCKGSVEKRHAKAILGLFLVTLFNVAFAMVTHKYGVWKCMYLCVCVRTYVCYLLLSALTSVECVLPHDLLCFLGKLSRTYISTNMHIHTYLHEHLLYVCT